MECNGLKVAIRMGTGWKWVETELNS